VISSALSISGTPNFIPKSDRRIVPFATNATEPPLAEVRFGLDIDRQRDRLAHAEHGEVAGDPRRVGVELFDLRRGKAHRWKSFGVEQSPALHEIVEGRGTDVDRTGFDGKGRKAFCPSVEIEKDLSPIMGKVAACRREANGIDLESDPRLRLVDAPTLRPRRRLRACATKKRQRPNNDNPALR
jgi:hypothetical protein